MCDSSYKSGQYAGVFILQGQLLGQKPKNADQTRIFQTVEAN